jgi:DNA-binding response OmpR family regulator
MSRILLAMDDVELAIELTCAFEHAGNEIEHVFDVAEALLRARITPPDVLIVDLDTSRVDHEPLRRWASHGIAPLVLTSTAWSGEQLARRLGAAYFLRPDIVAMTALHKKTPGDRRDLEAQPAWAAALIDIVDAAIVSRMGKAQPAGQRSGTMMAAPTVLVAARRANAREIVASFVKSQLGLRCVTATTASESVAALDGRVKAVLLDCDLLSGPDANTLLHEMNEQSLPIILLRLGPDDEDAAIGRAAWEAIPPLRNALKTEVELQKLKTEVELQKTSTG